MTLNFLYILCQRAKCVISYINTNFDIPDRVHELHKLGLKLKCLPVQDLMRKSYILLILYIFSNPYHKELKANTLFINFDKYSRNVPQNIVHSTPITIFQQP